MLENGRVKSSGDRRDTEHPHANSILPTLGTLNLRHEMGSGSLILLMRVDPFIVEAEIQVQDLDG
jgi:hypothetical protein